MALGIQRGRRRPHDVRPQGVEGSGMAGPGKTLGSPWIPLVISLWLLTTLPYELTTNSYFKNFDFLKK
jgi:hypothetical protein